MLAATTRRLRSAAATLATVVGLRKVDPREKRDLSDTEILALIVAEAREQAHREAYEQARREADRQAALAATPALVDATRAVMRMELRARACEGDAFALAALRMMAA
jgi:hypothetical protein